MSTDQLKNDLIQSIVELNEDRALKNAQKLNETGLSVFQIIQWLNVGMKEVGDRYENGDYFIADLILSGIIYRQILDLFNTNNQNNLLSKTAVVTVGTVEGDVHDIGKDILTSTLTANGFKVIDLGVDVKVDTFLASMQKIKPDILAISGTLTPSINVMTDIIKNVRNSNDISDLPILLGGLCVDEKISKQIGGIYAGNPLETLEICKKIIEKKEDSRV